MEITRKRTMNTLAASVLTLAMLLSPTQSFAWGTIGHKTIAEIAQTQLQPATAKRVSQLLNGSSMPSVATWADAAREKSEWAATAWYHFEKIYDGKNFVENLRGLSPEDQELGGVVMALLQAERVFVSKSASTADKANALKFIIHFVGDIHQPLHSGRPADKGGNKIPRVWNGFNTNLHAIWDSLIIEKGHEDIFALDKAGTKEKIYSPYLLAKFKSMKLTTAQLTDLNMWMDESLAMRPDAYTYMDDSEDQYTDRFIESVDERVYLAGIRLGAMLNQMVLKEQPPTIRVQFAAAVERVVGSLSNLISLKPRVAPVDDGACDGCGGSGEVRRFY